MHGEDHDRREQFAARDRRHRPSPGLTAALHTSDTKQLFRICLLSGSAAKVDFVRPIEAIVPGAQGRVLAVLVETAAELNLRTIAKRAGVSLAQASRVLPGLVELGVVERREVPPSSLFRLVPELVASRTLLALARSAEAAAKVAGRGQLWSDIRRDGRIVHGLDLDQLRAVRSG